MERKSHKQAKALAQVMDMFIDGSWKVKMKFDSISWSN
jgi:hypothetical protein